MQKKTKTAIKTLTRRRVTPSLNGTHEPLRLSKLMATRGLCSRREADEFIRQGLVAVDGVRVQELGIKVLPDVKVELLHKAQKQQAEKITILINKPVGYVSNLPEKGYTPAIELIRAESQDPQFAQEGPRFHPRHLAGLAAAGRLDIDSQGLLVLTQDGRLARQLIGQDSQVEKEYLVRFSGELNEEKLKKLCFGLSLDERPLKPAQVRQINPEQLQFILREGRKRQIRRMCELVGLRVLGLKRVRIGNVRLGRLTEGQWRYLREDESFT